VEIGGEPAEDVAVVSSTEITCTAPAGSAGAADVTVTNTDTGTVTETDGYTYVEFTIQPELFGIGGGQLFTITGDYFEEGMVVTIDGDACTDETVTDAQTMTAKTPAHAAEVGLPVSITYPDGGPTFEIGDVVFSSEPYSGADPIFEKNRLFSAGTILTLLEVTIPGVTDPIRLVRNNQDITWNSHTWRAFPFILGDISANSNGEISPFNIQVSNVTREIQTILEDTDGADGLSIKVMLIHTDHMEPAEPLWQATYANQQPSYDRQWVTFSCGLRYPASSRRPLFKYLKYTCPFVYGDIRCAVSSATKTTYPTCAKTLPACKERSNETRFGGELNIPGYYFG
jgi:hypothetical protein